MSKLGKIGDYSDLQIEETLYINNDSNTGAARDLGVSEASIRRWKKRTEYKGSMKVSKPVISDPKYKPKKVDNVHKVFIFTSAQSETKVNQGFLDSLKTYTKNTNGQLYVIPLAYRNIDSIIKRPDDEEPVWDSCLEEYLLFDDLIVNKNLIVKVKDINITATAVNPLTGLTSITGHKSAIFGHPQLALQSLPTTDQATHKLLTTTGSVTQKSFSRTKAGAIGRHHHTNAAVVVEVSGNNFYLRQIHWNGKGIYDLDKFYTPTEVIHDVRSEGLILGDLHDTVSDPKIDKATQEMIKTFNPKKIVGHDICDGMFRNPHHNNDSIVNTAKYNSGYDDGRTELNNLCKSIDEKYTSGDHKFLIVGSNHNDFIVRWIKDPSYDFRKDPVNQSLYLELASIVYNSIEMTDKKLINFTHPLEYYLKRYCKNHKKLMFVDRKGYKIKNIEVGLHGDKGPNGSRGSAVSLSKMPTKMMIGHSHTPTIKHGVYQVGVGSSLIHEYNTDSPSSWMNCHGVIYPDGKRSLLFIIDGKWRK